MTGLVAAVVLVMGGGTVGFAMGESGKRHAVKRAEVTSFNDGFADGVCRPVRGNHRTDGGGLLEDGEGNVCGEFEPK
ncbi:hypothetical protein [Streptomyces luteireticuli]|uniref:hypothetical protein n=1 Tax=Streptomyces luteireticuli TaxID=173858 RepID=UPI0031E32E2B